MITINIKRDFRGNLDQGLKRFKLKFNNAKIIDELREREKFVKKSIKKRQSKLKAVYIQKKKTESDE